VLTGGCCCCLLPPLPVQATLLEVLEKIVKHRLHRVYVVDAQEKPVGVVTCTDVLKLVSSHAQLKPSASQSALAGQQQQQQQSPATAAEVLVVQP
jgi:signal-transduction protein with cAMP-binding, CBS, and nucleotidyltransferase domain